MFLAEKSYPKTPKCQKFITKLKEVSCIDNI